MDFSTKAVDRVLLIVPCYNESRRLPVAAFEQDLPCGVDVLFANDGSTDETLEVLRPLAARDARFRIFHSPQNLGKGEVIRQAFLSLAEARLDAYKWVGFWDADLATPLYEVSHFLKYRELFKSDARAIFGSRVSRYGARIQRSPLRHYLSRVFVTFVDLILGIKAYDSQCGAKLFHRSVVNGVFQEVFISRWIFDLEIIFRLEKSSIVEVPLQAWRDVPDFKMKIAREAFRVWRDLWRIRQRYL